MILGIIIMISTCVNDNYRSILVNYPLILEQSINFATESFNGVNAAAFTTDRTQNRQSENEQCVKCITNNNRKV